MKTLKQIALAICISASLGAVSTSVMAEGDAGRITYAPADAIDMVATKVGLAITAIEQGDSADKASDLAKAALDAGKEINANDKVFAARDKVNSKVKKARVELKAGNRQEAEQLLRDAQKGYIALKGLL